MAGIGEIIVPVTIEVKTVKDSPELQVLLRDLIREELAHLSFESVQVITDQIVRQFEDRD